MKLSSSRGALQIHGCQCLLLTQSGSRAPRFAVDYFKGKRRKDAEVQRQFELLKRQAEIDCRELRELGDKHVTPESIEEDYIYNAATNCQSGRCRAITRNCFLQR